jgi:hypothetical protein
VYQQRCKSTGQERELIVLRDPRFAAECDALADFRLLLKRMEPNEEGKETPAWRFRHDKVLDFFLHIAITTGDPEKVKERMGWRCAHRWRTPDGYATGCRITPARRGIITLRSSLPIQRPGRRILNGWASPR